MESDTTETPIDDCRWCAFNAAIADLTRDELESLLRSEFERDDL